MSNEKYEKIILDRLLKKYNARQAKKSATSRRIQLKASDIYKDYTKNNADISIKQSVNDAVAELYRHRFITVEYLRFSTDIEKLYLAEEKIGLIYEYMQDEFGIIPQHIIANQIREIVTAYDGEGKLSAKYGGEVITLSKDPRCVLIPEKIEANMKMLAFLETNEEDLYVRELSMLVYGDSKWFENNNYDEVCTIIRTVTGIGRADSERNDAVLALYHVMPVEQEIFIKGCWRISWANHTLDVSKYSGGIALSSSDLQSIEKIIIPAEYVMTIENKTSYQRMNESNAAMMYLGGFATRAQIIFLKLVVQDNPCVKYYHFGDIDVGGFLIHKHLCREVSRNFELYSMGIEQLIDERYRHCLRELTDSDRSRLSSIMDEKVYHDTLMYMQEHNIKLEQEIVSYYLGKKAVAELA